MKLLSYPVIPQLANTTSPSIDIKYWINYLLYSESKINRRKISAETIMEEPKINSVK